MSPVHMAVRNYFLTFKNMQLAIIILSSIIVNPFLLKTTCNSMQQLILSFIYYGRQDKSQDALHSLLSFLAIKNFIYHSIIMNQG